MCFFAIARDKSLHTAFLKALPPAWTFALGHSTPFGNNGATIGMTQWLAQGATGRSPPQQHLPPQPPYGKR
jgi:hypothetical protein